MAEMSVLRELETRRRTHKASKEKAKMFSQQHSLYFRTCSINVQNMVFLKDFLFFLKHFCAYFSPVWTFTSFISKSIRNVHCILCFIYLDMVLFFTDNLNIFHLF